MDYFGYGADDRIPCEVCGSEAVDVHHIDPKGMGGSKLKDVIGNLAALCRFCHTWAHADREFNNRVLMVHKLLVRAQG